LRKLRPAKEKYNKALKDYDLFEAPIEHMKMMNYFSTRMLGTSMVRETENNIIGAGFKIEKVRRFLLGVVRIIVATK
jgi:hypothetical protein